MGKTLNELFLVDEVETSDRILIEQANGTRVVSIGQLDERYIQQEADLEPYATKNDLLTKANVEHEHDDYATKIDLERKFNEVFQNVNNGKNKLEAAIIDKGGIVSKENEIATFKELGDAISSIPNVDLEQIFPFDDVSIVFNDEKVNSDAYKVWVDTLDITTDELPNINIFGNGIDDVYAIIYNGLNKTYTSKIYKLYIEDGKLKHYPHIIHCGFNSISIQKDKQGYRPDEYVITLYQTESGLRNNTYFFVNFNNVNWTTEGETNIDDLCTTENKYVSYLGDITLNDDKIYDLRRNGEVRGCPLSLSVSSITDSHYEFYDLSSLGSQTDNEFITPSKVLKHPVERDQIYIITRELVDLDSFDFRTMVYTLRLNGNGKFTQLSSYMIPGTDTSTYYDGSYMCDYYISSNQSYAILLSGSAFNKIYKLEAYKDIKVCDTFEKWYTGRPFMDPLIYEIIPYGSSDFLIRTGGVINIVDSNLTKWGDNYVLEPNHMLNYTEINMFNESTIALNVSGAIVWIYDIKLSPFFEYKTKVTYTTSFTLPLINQILYMDQSSYIYGNNDYFISTYYVNNKRYVGLSRLYDQILGVKLVK